MLYDSVYVYIDYSHRLVSYIMLVVLGMTWYAVLADIIWYRIVLVVIVYSFIDIRIYYHMFGTIRSNRTHGAESITSEEPFSRKSLCDVTWAQIRWRVNCFTLNLPTNIIPTNIAWLKLSGKIPYGQENSTPLNWDYPRVKPSEIHNVSREIGRNRHRHLFLATGDVHSQPLVIQDSAVDSWISWIKQCIVL